MDRREEGQDQFGDDEDEGWSIESDPLDNYEGIEYALLSCIDTKGVIGMSLAEILECCDTYDVADIGEALQKLTKEKTINKFHGIRYFIGVL